MLLVNVRNDRVHIGDRFSVSLQRTRRAAAEGLRHPLPSRGPLPIRLVSATRQNGSSDTPSVVAPCGTEEAVWLGFVDVHSQRVALKIRVGTLNAITGSAWHEALRDDPMDYVVPPDQTSWHGIRGADGMRQFGDDPVELVVYEPIQPIANRHTAPAWDRVPLHGEESGDAHGRREPFQIAPDRYGIGAWSHRPDGRVTISFVDAGRWRLLTGDDPPEPRDEYQGHRLP